MRSVSVRSVRMSAVVVVATLAGIMAPAAGATAAVSPATATPTVSLSASAPKIYPKSVEKLRYSASHLPHGSVGYLQQRSGHKWRIAARLGKRTHGVVRRQWSKPGARTFRVLYRHHSRKMAVSRPVTVRVLGRLSVALHGVRTKIATGHAPVFRYKVVNLATGYSAQLQRTFGTSHKWRAVASLAARTNAKVTAPKLTTLGKYTYRVAVVHGGKKVRSSAGVTVYAYGKVPLAPLCGTGNCTGTVQVGSTIFTYTDAAYAYTYPTYDKESAFTKTSCRSLSVRFAGDNAAQHNNATSYLEFVQSTLDPVYAQTPPGQISSITVKLDGGPLYIDSSSSTGDGVVLNMTGSCYTVSGAS